jgi:tetratricopeptide (TPR) repeat protein
MRWPTQGLLAALLVFAVTTAFGQGRPIGSAIGEDQQPNATVANRYEQNERFALFGMPKIIFPAGAEEGDLPICSNGDGEVAIAACTREIDLYRGYKTGATRSLTFSLLDRGMLYAVQGRYELAIPDFDESIRIFPKNAPSHNWRGQAYGMKGDNERAIQDFSQAIRLDPTFAAPFYNRAQTYRVQGKYELAIRDFSQAVRLNPNFIAAYRMRGSAYHAIDKYDAAIADFSKAIELRADYAAAFVGRGLSYVGKKDDERAILDFNQAIRLSPAYAETYVFRALIYANKGENDRAIADLDAAIGLAPRLAYLYVLRGDLRRAKSDGSRALADFENAIKLDPANAQRVGALAWSRQGDMQISAGNLDTAIVSYNEAIQRDPKRASFFLRRAAAWSGKGDFARAEKDYIDAVSIQPNLPSAFAGRGIARFAQGNFGGAAEDFSRLEQGAGNAYAAIWLYLARTRAGRSESSDDLARTLARLKPPAWPAPLAELFLGQRPAEAVLSAASNSQERCEAQFYVAQWHLLKNARLEATNALEAAIRECPRSAAETIVSFANLKELKP